VTASQATARPGEALAFVDLDGERWPLDSERWHAAATVEERSVLARCGSGPVLDVGCGPGRLVVALGEAGVPSLGVDAAPSAVALARERGAPVLQRSIFDELPGEGRWGALLLFDGNVGIGGDPVRLLARLVELLDPAGVVIVEVEGPGAETCRRTVRLERGASCSPWFPWAVVSVDDIQGLAAPAALRVRDVVVEAGRWFVELVHA
jgi:SAM-dependent methyltransferase